MCEQTVGDVLVAARRCLEEFDRYPPSEIARLGLELTDLCRKLYTGLMSNSMAFQKRLLEEARQSLGELPMPDVSAEEHDQANDLADLLVALDAKVSLLLEQGAG